MSYTDYQKDIEVFYKFLNTEKDVYKRSSACSTIRSKYPNYHIHCKCNCCSCFDSDGIVSMKDNTYKKIKDIEKDDVLSNGATIVCKIVYKSDCEIELVKYQNLTITPYHPVFVNNKWTFPKDLSSDNYDYKNIVYNFVLDSHHIMVVDGIECVTLGHNFSGDVIEHPYFGTNKVIDDLKQHKGWNSGVIEYYNVHFARDSDGLVCGML